MFQEKHFVEEKDENLKSYKNLSRVRNLKTGISYVLRTMNFREEANAEKMLTELLRQGIIQDDNVIKIFHVDFNLVEMKYDKLQGDPKYDSSTKFSNQLKVYMEDFSETLESIIKLRKKSNESFHISEIKLILKNLIEGICCLENGDYPARDIAPHNIFFLKEPGFKGYKIGDMMEIPHILSKELTEFTDLCENTMNYIDPETKSIILYYISKEEYATRAVLNSVPSFNRSIYSTALLVIELITGIELKGINNKDFEGRKSVLFSAWEKILINCGFLWWDLLKFMIKPSKKTGIYKAKDLLCSKKFLRAMDFNESARTISNPTEKKIFTSLRNPLSQIIIFQTQLNLQIFHDLKALPVDDLKEISIRFCDFSSEDVVREFIEFLLRPRKLRVFRFSGNKNISTDNTLTILNSAKWLPHLKILEMTNQALTFEMVSILAMQIPSSKLRWLNLASNQELGDSSISMLVKTQFFKSLIALSIGGPVQGCCLSWDSIKILLKSTTKLRYLDFSWNYQEEGLERAIGNKIDLNLSVLDVSYCGFPDQVVDKIFTMNKRVTNIINKKNALVESIFETVKEKYNL